VEHFFRREFGRLCADPVAWRAPASTSSTTLFRSGVDTAALDDLVEAA
jgi:hypothetical protein